MAIDPVTGMLIGTIGSNLLGGLFGGSQANKDRKLQQQQLDLQRQIGLGNLGLDRDRFGLEKQAYGAQQQRLNNAAPYQQQILAMLLGRLGAGNANGAQIDLSKLLAGAVGQGENAGAPAAAPPPPTSAPVQTPSAQQRAEEAKRRMMRLMLNPTTY